MNISYHGIKIKKNYIYLLYDKLILLMWEGKMIDRRMDSFLTVCDTMNYTRAAEKLCITQPAVSMHIRQLEEEYGTKLFAYSEKKLSLTRAGEMLRRYAVTAGHDDRILKDKIAEISGAYRIIRCGATLTAGPYVAAGFLGRALLKDPETNTRMIIDSTERLLGLLDRGEIDFAMIEGQFSHSEYGSIRYSSEPFCAVAAAEHRFGRTIKSAEDLLDERILVREKGSGTRAVMEAYLGSRNLSIDDFPHRVEVNNIEILKSLAEMGCGITFLYERAVEKEIERGSLQKMALPGMSSLRHDFSIVFSKGSMFADEYREIFDI